MKFRTFKFLVVFIDTEGKRIERIEKVRGQSEHAARRALLNELINRGFQVTLISSTFEGSA